MIIPKPITLVPKDADFHDRIAALPLSGGLYCLFIEDGSPHLAWSANLLRRLKRLFFSRPEGDGASASELRRRLARIECWPTSSKLENSLLMYSVARRLFPEDYGKRLRLRLPWFVGTANNDGFPRLAVSNRKGRRRELLWGPFASREAAEHYTEEVLRLYQIRRCTEPLRPSAEHPGCIYGEINQCVRPCQCAVTGQEYETEFGRVSEFLRSNGKTALSALSAARAAASENMQFEQAAQIHRRMEQVKATIGAREEFVTELRDFNGVAVTKGRTSGSEVRLWPMLEGCWQEPISLDVSVEQATSKSLDANLKEQMTHMEAVSSTEEDPFEHLSLFLRWYRSSWRDGAWLGFSSLSTLNYRRLVREVSKLAREA